MNHNQFKVAICLLFAPLLYYGASAAMIEYSVARLSQPQSCLVLIHFDHSGYLVSMGQRSVPALHRQIANPTVGLRHQMRLAEVLCHIGDYSKFPVLIQGLASKRHQFIAAHHMNEFPKQCLKHMPEIVKIGRQPQEGHYWQFFMELAHNAKLSEAKRDQLDALLSADGLTEGQRGLSEHESKMLIQTFAAPSNP